MHNAISLEYNGFQFQHKALTKSDHGLWNFVFYRIML